MTIKRFISIATSMCMLVACKDGQKPEPYVIRTFDEQPFLGETYIEDYNFEKGNEFLVNTFISNASGACSAMRQGNFHARNLDWFLKDYALLVVHTPAKEGRFASVGVISSSSVINRGIIASGMVPEETATELGTRIGGFREMLPIFTTDGINEKGVSVNINIVLHEDQVRDSFVPCTGNGGSPVSFHAIPRFVLDNCESVDDAIEKLSRLSVVQDTKGPLSAEDGHYLISDPEKSAVVEWYDNKFTYVTYDKADGFHSKNGLPCIMTNFYVNQWEKFTTDGVTDWDALYNAHPSAMGVERALTLADGFDGIETLPQIQNQIEKVFYSTFYKPETKWYSDNAGSYYPANGAWYHKHSDKAFPNAEEAMKDLFNVIIDGIDSSYGSLDIQMKNLENGVESDNWYTELTSVFDLSKKEIWLLPQEGWYKKQYYRFGL